MVLAIVLAALGVAAVLALAYVIGTRAARSGRLAADERVTAALEQQAALLTQQAAQLEARLGMEREHTVTAAADMAAKMAGEKLGDSMTSGTRQLDLRTTAFEKRVEGLTTQLERLGDVVGALQKEGAHNHGQLLSGLKEATSSTRALAETTGHLREALASPKARGQWGERMADDVLRLAGMVEGVTYRKQTGIAGGAIPDVTFLLPGGRVLHMDVKFPVDNYLRHLEADTDAERDTLAKAFLRDVRGRVKELSTRTGYIDADATLDEVLLVHPERERVGVHPRARPAADRRRPRPEGRAVLAGEPVRRAGRDPAGRRADAPRPHQQRDPRVPRWLRQGVDEVLRVARRRGPEGFDTAQRGLEDVTGPRRRQLERQLDRIEDLRASRERRRAAAALRRRRGRGAAARQRRRAPVGRVRGRLSGVSRAGPTSPTSSARIEPVGAGSFRARSSRVHRPDVGQVRRVGDPHPLALAVAEPRHLHQERGDPVARAVVHRDVRVTVAAARAPSVVRDRPRSSSDRKDGHPAPRQRRHRDGHRGDPGDLVDEVEPVALVGGQLALDPVDEGSVAARGGQADEQGDDRPGTGARTAPGRASPSASGSGCAPPASGPTRCSRPRSATRAPAAPGAGCCRVSPKAVA